MLVGGAVVVAVAVLCIGALAFLAYQRSRTDDPGLTTEIALILTALLGGLAMRDAALAAGTGAALALLLATRDRIHHFVRGVLSEQELHDALLFAAAVLIILPLAPDRAMGPYGAVNPHQMVLLIVLVMGINALGYIASRVLGPRYGLPVAGLAGGFVSSTATIHAMGTRIRGLDVSQPDSLGIARAATAGGVLSSVATLAQLLLVLWLVNRDLAMRFAIPVLAGMLVSMAYSIYFVRRSVNGPAPMASAAIGRAFNPVAATGFVGIVGVLLVLAATLNAWFGAQGLLLSALIGGLLDPHAAAASVAATVSRGGADIEVAVWSILVAVSANAVTKVVVAYQSGGPQYAGKIAPGLALGLAPIWILSFFINAR